MGSRNKHFYYLLFYLNLLIYLSLRWSAVTPLLGFVTADHPRLRLIESITTLREGLGTPIQVSKIWISSSWMLQILETRIVFPSPKGDDWLFFSYLLKPKNLQQKE